jgi:hypothetical protein
MFEHPTYQLIKPDNILTSPSTEIPEKRVSDVVRVYPFIKRPVHEIVADLKQGYTPEEICYFNIVFMENNGVNNPGSGFISPIGGPLDPSETPLLGAYRHLMDKTTHLPVEFPSKETLKNTPYRSEDSFIYKVGKSRNKSLKAYVVAMEVTELEGRKSEIIDPVHQVRQKLSAYETQDVIEKITGLQESNLIGSSRIGLHDDIRVTGTHGAQKDRTMQSLMNKITQKEGHFKIRLLNKINELRSTSITSASTSGDEIHTVTLTLPGGHKKSQQLQNRTQGKQVEMILRLNDASDEELITAFNHLKKQDMMKTFREIEKQQNTTPIEVNLGANLGKDLLYYAQLFSYHEPENFTSLAAKTDRATIATLRLMRDVLRSSLEEVFERNTDLLLAIYGSEENFSTLFSATNATTKNFQEKQELSRMAMNPLIDLYKNYSKEAVTVQLEFENELSEVIIRNLASRFDLQPSDVVEVKTQANRMQAELIDSALSTDPEFANIYQLHRTLNEVQNANFAQLLLLDLGVLPHEVGPGVMQMTRFEASRLTVQILKGLTGYKRHKELTSEENITPFQKLVSIVYGPVVRQKEVELRYKDIVIKQTHLFRRGPGGTEVIVDEKERKSLLSYVRKSFEVKHEDIHDGISFNVALAPEEDGLTLKSAISSIRKMNRLIKTFRETAEELYGQNYEVNIKDDKNTYNNLLIYLQQQETGEVKVQESTGKRAGSIASNIIRRKFILELKNRQTQKSAYCEFVFYPFTELAKYTNDEFLGLNEKLVDAKSYEFRRITTPLDPTRVGFPSGYELTNPPQIYERAVTVYQHRKTQDRKRRTK